MHSVASAQVVVEGLVRAGASESVLLESGAGRYLAEPLLAGAAVPAHACSAMDGWALAASDASRPLRAGAQPIYAGDPPGRTLGPGEAMRIFTGGLLPAGADCVVREEVADLERGEVRVRARPAVGENVRLAGEDVAAGAVALERGTQLGPRQLGFCAALGVDRLCVTRRPRIGLLSTGDEIARGMIQDSNGQALAQALRAVGCEVEAHVVSDEPERLRAGFGGLLASCDAVLSTGGVSVGEKDLVPAALEALGARILVHGVSMKPGKPFLVATLGARPVFALPGSPSACLVAFEVFVRPAVLALAGAAQRNRRALSLPLQEAVSGRPGRTRFLWARLTATGQVEPLGRDTAQIRGPALAQALVRVPEEVGDLAAGALVETWLLEGSAP